MSKKIQTEKFNLRLLISVSILSAAIMAYEIQLMQFFSIVQWDHFAAMVISIALLGFGASGTLLSIYRKWMINRSQFLIPFFMISSGILMTISLRLSQSDYFFFDSYTLFQGQGQLSRLAMTYLLFFLPFFSGALAIGLVFIRKVSDINLYYFADLFGAGLGAVSIMFLFWMFKPAHIFLILSVIAIVSGLLLCKVKKDKFLLLYALCGCVILGYYSKYSIEGRTSRYKSISYALNLPDAVVEKEYNSPYGLTQVVTSPALRYAPGLSFKFNQKVNASPMVYNNGNWNGSIPMSNDSHSVLDFTTMALPYWLGQYQRVLLLDISGGLNVQQAVQHDSDEVHAVEPNAMVLNLLENDYSTQTDSLFFHPRVSWHNMAVRSFVDQAKTRYDLIQFPLLGSFGGDVGLNAMKEENLITSEAFEKLWTLLKPNGVLVFSCWTDQPPKLSLKLVNMIAELLNMAGVERPSDHMAAVRSWGTMTFALKKSAFSDRDKARVSDFCEEFEFDQINLEHDKVNSVEFFNELQDTTFLDALLALFSQEKDSIVQNHPFNISGATDNKPYFYRFLRFKNVNLKNMQSGSSESRHMELGYLLSWVTLVQVVFFALLFIFLPLFKLGWKGTDKRWLLGYFAAIGLGYMFVEIVMIKYFVPYLGHPIYSIASVISLMLIFSGLGSLYASKFSIDGRNLPMIFTTVSGLSLLYAVLLTPALSFSQTWPLVWKLILMITMIGIPAFFMGMPFPIGLKMIASKSESQVPWAWGINGCLSVISSALAPLIALEMGFSAVLIIGALVYFLALISGLKMKSVH